MNGIWGGGGRLIKSLLPAGPSADRNNHDSHEGVPETRQPAPAGQPHFSILQNGNIEQALGGMKQEEQKPLPHGIPAPPLHSQLSEPVVLKLYQASELPWEAH